MPIVATVELDADEYDLVLGGLRRLRECYDRDDARYGDADDLIMKIMDSRVEP